MPLGQSKGMYMHNAAFGNPRAVYCRFPVAQLKPFVRHIVPMLHGFSVTLPHKEKIMQYVDRVDSTTRAIGAVNTVVRRGGQLVGTNTDAPGALDAIERTGSVQGKTVLIVGAGGAARAVAYEAVRRGARVLIANRHMARARRLALEVGALAIPVAKIPRAEFDILANTTPAGMTPDVTAIPVPPSTLGGKIVFDAVYNPPLTRLLREARARGSRIVPGTAMYVNQAAEQSRLYTGRRPSKALLRRALERHLTPLPQ
jgi:shikimate dehydrogenase